MNVRRGSRSMARNAESPICRRPGVWHAAACVPMPLAKRELANPFRRSGWRPAPRLFNNLAPGDEISSMLQRSRPHFELGGSPFARPQALLVDRRRSRPCSFRGPCPVAKVRPSSACPTPASARGALPCRAGMHVLKGHPGSPGERAPIRTRAGILEPPAPGRNLPCGASRFGISP